MKIITNYTLIKRNRRIGQFSTILALIILGIGLYVSFQNELMGWSFSALLIGFLLSQIGIFYISRWGRTPRPDQKINQSLKGLDDKYTIYHYKTPAPHFLVGPAGLYSIIPAHQSGIITYDDKKGRWKQKGGNLYMKIFAQESLGRPDLELSSSLKDLNKYLSGKLADVQYPEPQGLLFFTNEKANVQAGNSPIPTLQENKLKEFIRRKSKESQLSLETIGKIRDRLPKD